MNSYRIQELLLSLKNSIEILAKGISTPVNSGFTSFDKEAALNVIQLNKLLASYITNHLIHHKTRIKLEGIAQEVVTLAMLCELIASEKIPELFDIKILRIEIEDFCLKLLSVLENSISYYGNEQRKIETASTNFYSDSPTKLSRAIKPAAKKLAAKYFDLIESAGIPKKAKKNNDSQQHLKINNKFVEVPVFFGTTRSLNENPHTKQEIPFLKGRGSGQLTLGISKVTIPPGHYIGKFERPLRIWKICVNPNPEKHITLSSVKCLETNDWLSSINKQLEFVESRSAFIFIHGFNVSFNDSMMRSAQIAHDLSYRGLVTAFSWGSQEAVTSYMADEDAVNLSAQSLIEFLRKLSNDAKIKTFHIVAHSMGCRALLAALQDTSWWSCQTSPVAEAVFAAPDIDAQQFKGCIKGISQSAGRYTLYGSESDWAMKLSKAIRSMHPRAGAGGQNVLVVQGVETIDVTDIGSEIFGYGHGYLSKKRSILNDLWLVFRGTAMTRFGLHEINDSIGKYWLMRS